MIRNSLRSALFACLAALAPSLVDAPASAQDLFGLNLFGQPAVAVAPAQPIYVAPAAVTYVPEARGLFGRRIAYRPVVTYPAAVPAVSAVTPVAAYAPSVVTAGYAPIAAAPVATTSYYAPQVAPQIATTSYYAPAVASPGCGCASAAPVTAYLPSAPVASGCSTCSGTTNYYAPVVAAPAVVTPMRRLPYDPPVSFTGLFALPN